MKKLLCLICILSVLIILPACQSKTNENSEHNEDEPKIETENNKDNETNQEIEDVEEEKDLPLDQIIDESSIVKLLQKGAAINEISYDLTFTYEDEGISMESKYWQKGNLMKTVAQSIDGKVVTIFDKDEVITYYPDEKTGFRYSQSYEDEFNSDNMNVVGEQYFKNVSYSFIENSSLNGEKCIVVSMQDSDGNQSRLWISTKYGIVLKYEGADEGGTFTSEAKNISTNSIPDGTFDVPSDIIFEDDEIDEETLKKQDDD